MHEQFSASQRRLDLAEVARRCFPVRVLDADQARAVAHGRRLAGLALPGDPTAVLGPDGGLLALYRPCGDEARPVSVFTDGAVSAAG